MRRIRAWSADFQFRDGVLDVVVADAVAENPPAAPALDDVEGGLLGEFPGLRQVLQELDVQFAGHGRDRHQVQGVLGEAAFGAAGLDRPQRHDAGGMVDAGRRPQQNGFLELFGELEGIGDDRARLIDRGGFEHRQPGELGVIAVVLFVLARKHGGVVGGQDHHAALDADIGERHEGIGRHVEAHVLHHGHAAHPAGRGRGGHFHRDFFVGAVLEVEVALLGDLKEVERQLRGGRAGVGAGEGDARLDGAAGNGLVAEEQHSFTGLVGQELVHHPTLL